MIDTNEYMETERLGNTIKVIGVGGGGNSAVENMYAKNIQGVDFIISDTDVHVLDRSSVFAKIQLGKQIAEGRDEGCDPNTGRDAALESIDEIKKRMFENTKIVFIVVGLGGETGTGASPVIAKAIKARGILAIAIVSLPFKDEGEEPYRIAVSGVFELRKHADSLLIVNNQRLFDMYHNLSIFDAFLKADDILTAAARSIIDVINGEGVINLNVEDIGMIMKNGDIALIGLGRAAGENRMQQAAEQALKSPLLDGNNIAEAKYILLNVGSGTLKPLMMGELKELQSHICAVNNGFLIQGFSSDLSLDDESSDAEITVAIIATGFSRNTSFPDTRDLTKDDIDD